MANKHHDMPEMTTAAVDADTAADIKAELEKLKAELEHTRSALAQTTKEKDELKELTESQSRKLDDRVSQQEAANRKLLQEEMKYRITINSGKESNERCPVPVGINGHHYLIERDKAVDVPASVLRVLGLAVEKRAQERENGDGVEFVDTHRFAYTVHGVVDPVTGEVTAI